MKRKPIVKPAPGAGDVDLPKPAELTDVAASAEKQITEGFSPEQKNVYDELLRVMGKNAETMHNPVISDDSVITMDLMWGGKIVIKKVNGDHIMRAARGMVLAEDKGSEMQAIYTMVAAADIDGFPMEMHHIGERLSGRDFMVLQNWFQRINLF